MQVQNQKQRKVGESAITLRLPENLLAQLKKLATSERRSYNAQAVYLLDRGINKSVTDEERQFLRKIIEDL